MSEPQNLGNGRWIVDRTTNFVQWCAWRFWLHRETGRTGFPEKLCVWAEWPPKTMEGAQIVVQKIRETRQHPKVQSDLPVCDPAQPWDGFSYNEAEDLRRRHRENFAFEADLPPSRISRPKAGPYETETQKEVREWMNEQAAKLPKVPRGKGLHYLRAIMADKRDAAQ